MSKKKKKNNNTGRPKSTVTQSSEPAASNETKTLKASAETNDLGSIYLSFLKWTVIAVVVGICVGIVGALFHHSLDFATEFRTENPNIIFALPVAGLMIVALYKLLGMENDRGTNAVISEARGEKSVSLKLAPAIFAAAFLTHLTGGSAGREGAALQIGASVASPINKILKLDNSDRSVLAMCGMAAGFSSLFGTPVAAAVFAMEVTVVGIAQYSAIVPCIISSVAASFTASLIGVAPTNFGIPTAVEFGSGNAMSLFTVLILGILCALVSILFCEAMHFAGKTYKKYIANPYLRVLAGSALVIGLTLLFGTYEYNGAGGDIIMRAIGGEARPEAFILKIILTALTLGAGFKGGEIVPSFFVGSTFGCAVAPLLGLDPSFGAAIGLLAVFCGVTNCPLATIILSVELFGADNIIYCALAIGISYMLSGYYGLYTEQTFHTSKSKNVSKT